jgi:hypothetical protein
MPTHVRYAPKGEITAQQKLEIAAGIARIHSRFTGAPIAFSQCDRAIREASQASHNGYVWLAQRILARTFHQRGNVSHGVLTRCAPRQQRQPNGCGLSHITNPLRMPVVIEKVIDPDPAGPPPPLPPAVRISVRAMPASGEHAGELDAVFADEFGEGARAVAQSGGQCIGVG